MNRRTFLLASGVAALAPAAPAATTILYGDRAVTVDKVLPDPKELWVRKADLPKINDFEVKPQGACRNDVCIPISNDLRRGDWFNLTGFARKTGEASIFDSESRVWSFGEIPLMRGSFTNSRIAPDFAVADRKGRTVHLTDFRGKKVPVVTWASW